MSQGFRYVVTICLHHHCYLCKPEMDGGDPGDCHTDLCKTMSLEQGYLFIRRLYRQGDVTVKQEGLSSQKPRHVEQWENMKPRCGRADAIHWLTETSLRCCLSDVSFLINTHGCNIQRQMQPVAAGWCSRVAALKDVPDVYMSKNEIKSESPSTTHHDMTQIHL